MSLLYALAHLSFRQKNNRKKFVPSIDKQNHSNMYSATRTKKHSQIAVKSRRSPPSHSAEKIANNEDLLTQILLNLPTKSILRFKSVSKYWLSLISDPQFSQLRRRHNILPCPISGLFLGIRPRCIHYNTNEFDFVNLNLIASNSAKAPFRFLTFTDNQSRIRIVQSCNGLLLCCSDGPLETRENFVYNPTTQQFRKLPHVLRIVFGFSLAFDPSKSPHYKVICVRSCEAAMEGRYQIDVYSPVAREWRLAGESFYAENMEIQFDGGIFSNGSVYWISNREESVYFNVDEERVGPFPMPPGVENMEHPRSYRYFGESRGHLLSIIDHTHNLQLPQFDVYEMESDHSQWTVKFQVDLSNVPSEFPQIVCRTSHEPSLGDYVFSVLCVVCDEIDEESYLVLQIPGKVLRYNLISERFFKLRDVEARTRIINTETLPCGNSVAVTFPDLAEWPRVYQFIESLALI